MHPLIRVGYFEQVLGIYLNDEGEELPPPEGTSGLPATVLAIVKSFVGSGITFLPGAFEKAGWLFAAVVLTVIGFFNAYCIHLLLECSRKAKSSSFADIAHQAVGWWGKLAVQISLVLSQFGTNVAYIIFIADIAMQLGAGEYYSVGQIVGAQLMILIPLSLIRQVHRLEYPVLGADALIMFGLGVMLWYNSRKIASVGVGPGIKAVKLNTCGIFVGTAVFTFEGIPMTFPIRQAMREPERYWPVFIVTFTGIVAFFVTFSLLGYVAYGNEVRSVVMLNLPDHDLVPKAVKVAYAVALLLGSPLTFLPGGRITELWIFGVVKQKGQRKWSKNAVRAAEFCLFGVLAVYGGPHFETFLAIVGALCCAPIAFIYPALFHWTLCATSWPEKVADAFFIFLGFGAGALVFYQALFP